MYYNRITKQLEEEKEYQKNILYFLYNTFPGRIILKTIAARPWFSKLRGRYYNSTKSKKEIYKFVQDYNIQTNPKDYNSFNDFFTRYIALDNKTSINELMAIADSKLSYYKITEDLHLKIKNSVYTIKDIIKNDKLAKEYKNGICLIFRLTVDDVHHYFYPASGTREFTNKIKGELHTVRPISEKYKIYSRNSREVSLLNTEELGQVIQIEVGALLIGKINNAANHVFMKGDHKGYFEYGGSTIVLLLKENTVVIDDDIKKYMNQGYETKVTAGEKIGRIL